MREFSIGDSSTLPGESQVYINCNKCMLCQLKFLPHYLFPPARNRTSSEMYEFRRQCLQVDSVVSFTPRTVGRLTVCLPVFIRQMFPVQKRKVRKQTAHRKVFEGRRGKTEYWFLWKQKILDNAKVIELLTKGLLSVSRFCRFSRRITSVIKAFTSYENPSSTTWRLVSECCGRGWEGLLPAREITLARDNEPRFRAWNFIKPKTSRRRILISLSGARGSRANNEGTGEEELLQRKRFRPQNGEDPPAETTLRDNKKF